MAAKIITLLTDFGLEDHYVASMKGVILGICPEARLVDISHLIPPQDVRSGAYVLKNAYGDFPEGAVHVAVVDPGVGTDRRALVVRTDSHAFVGPDNGLFSWILKEETAWAAWSLDNPRFWRDTVSKTFHGRDIFAPVAAHLACGIPPDTLGHPCSPMLASWSYLSRSEHELSGEVIHIDHFGNVITNITRKDLEGFLLSEPCKIRVHGHTIERMAETYGQYETGSAMVILGSGDHLEIAVNQGSAAKMLGIQAGTNVSVTRG